MEMTTAQALHVNVSYVHAEVWVTKVDGQKFGGEVENFGFLLTGLMFLDPKQLKIQMSTQWRHQNQFMHA